MRGRAPVSQALVIVDKPVEGSLHDNEGRCCLSQFAERHGAAEIFRSAQDPGYNRRKQKISVRNERRADKLPAEFAPPKQNSLQLELQCFTAIALPAILTSGFLVEGVGRSTKFRFRLVAAFDDGSGRLPRSFGECRPAAPQRSPYF